MGTEVWTEFLDLLAFGLVTPAILGADRVDEFRRTLERWFGSIAESWGRLAIWLAVLAVVLAVSIPTILLFYEWVRLCVEVSALPAVVQNGASCSGLPEVTFDAIGTALGWLAVSVGVVVVAIAGVAVGYPWSTKRDRVESTRIAAILGAVVFLCSRVLSIIVQM